MRGYIQKSSGKVNLIKSTGRLQVVSSCRRNGIERGERIKRDIRFDNIKGILILLVVFGHLLELVHGGVSKAAYLVIYSFHMPAFVFVSGYFAAFELKKILKKQILPYFVWYVIYFAFFGLIFAEGKPFDPSTPYWLTWYLMSMVWWSMSIPLLSAAGSKQTLPVIATLCVVSVVWGFCGASGYWLSIGRTLTFFPFFAAGWFLRRNGLPEKINPPAKAAAAALAVIFGAVCIVFSEFLDISCFYGAKSYAQQGQSFIARTFQLLSGGAWIWFLLCFAPKTRLPILTDAGKYSIAVYLGHGIIVHAMKKLIPGGVSGDIWVLVGLGLAMLLTAALGNPWAHGAISKTFTPVSEWRKRKPEGALDKENTDAV